MVTEHFYESIPGYFTFKAYYRRIALNAGARWRGVELGCFKGKSAAYLGVELEHNHLSECDARLDLVDVFREQGQSWLEVRDNLLRLIDSGVVGAMHEGNSWEAAQHYDDASLDFVFVDASHEYLSVKADIREWLPKIKKGGILAGHDYCAEFPGVMLAVTEAFDSVTLYRGELDGGDERMTGNYYPVWERIV